MGEIFRSDVNRSAVLAQLGATGSASRAELARALEVSPALMTQLTRDLLEEGLIQELESAPSQGGRPPRMLGLVATAGSAIGVKVAADHVAFVEVSLDGTILRSASEPFNVSSPVHFAALVALLRRFMEGVSASRLLGIGVGIPGSVDEQSDGIVNSTQLGWSQVPLGASLRQALGVPVLVENNVNALAVAERLYGSGRRYSNFFVVTIGTGVGAAIVSDGHILRGFSGGAGEFGHTPIDPSGPVCVCGNRGCLEAYISETNLIQQAREKSVIDDAGAMTQLLAAAEDGNPVAMSIFNDAGAVFGRALAGAVHLLAPEVVILLGEGTVGWAYWASGFESSFRSWLIPARHSVNVLVENWQDASWAQGAAALVLATPFESNALSGAQGALVRRRLVDQAAPGSFRPEVTL